MFSVDDYIVYGSEGVCRVESIGRLSISGLDPAKDYYTLMPVNRSARIYTPVDSPITMRRVMTKESANNLLDSIKDINSSLDVPKDAKQAMLYYKALIRTYECENLVRIIKYVSEKQRRYIPIKKNVPAVDFKFLKAAQDMLYGELSFALQLPVKDVKANVESLCL